MAQGAKHSIQALDDFHLDAAIFSSPGLSNPSLVAVINSGAGIPKRFYGAFAAWLADRGIPTITYDYRGIGGSASKPLQNFAVTIEDWGSKDCAAVLNYARTLYPAAKILVVGHSIGGIVTGFVRNDAPRIHRLMFISPHTGYLGDYAWGSRWKMFLLWHVIMPLITRSRGYFPGRALGLPEDLPAGVALAWGRRRFKWNIASDSSYATCSHIATDGLCVRPSDDLFATESAFRRVQARFNAAKFTDVVLEVTHRKERLGHFGFFNSGSEERWWPIALEWLAYGRSPKLEPMTTGTSNELEGP